MLAAVNDFLWGQLLIVMLIALRLLRDCDDQLKSGVQPRFKVEDYADLEIDEAAWKD